MQQMSNTLILLFSCLLLFNCGRDFYVPNTANLLTLEHKKDLKASLSINSAQVAYSPIQSLGLKADYSFVRNVSNLGTRGLNMGTIGIGYYGSKKINPLSENSHPGMRRPKQPSVGFDIFANFSLGKIQTSNNSLSSFSSTILLNSFEADILKPSLSAQVFCNLKMFTVNLGLRTSYLNYYNACLLYTSPSPRDQRGSRMPSSA